ncbi:hypothetical protein AB0H76_14340 [Nocardia sp. NPDC050712]|uniref:hypothetical protein n=1 Tax=Nocardia sp. NPDC050712 TaxID=3155518 RepID=UPI0033CC35C1
MGYQHFEIVDALLPIGTDVDAVLESGDEHALFALWNTYHRVQFLHGVLDKIGDAESATEEKRAGLCAELAGLSVITATQALQSNRRLIDLLIGRRWAVMRDIRETGGSWTAIGGALGMSKQGALDWYQRKIEQQEKYVGEWHDADRARAVVGEDLADEH